MQQKHQELRCIVLVYVGKVYRLEVYLSLSSSRKVAEMLFNWLLNSNKNKTKYFCL